MRWKEHPCNGAEFAMGLVEGIIEISDSESNVEVDSKNGLILSTLIWLKQNRRLREQEEKDAAVGRCIKKWMAQLMSHLLRKTES